MLEQEGKYNKAFESTYHWYKKLGFKLVECCYFQKHFKYKGF